MKQNTPHLFVELLQNGYPVARYQRSIKKRGPVLLGDKSSVHLRVPHYDIGTPRSLATIDTRGVQLYAEPGMEGFAINSGARVFISPLEKTTRIINLQVGDKASLSFDDLTAIFRVGNLDGAKPTSKFIQPQYRGSFIKSAAEDRTGVTAFSTALLAAVVCFAGITYGFAARRDDTPRKFSDLPEQYSLRFIHPLHLQNAPEALQNHLNRADYIGSVTAYYDGLNATLINAPVDHPDLLFNSTKQIWSNIYTDIQREKENIIARSEARKSVAEASSNSALLLIPVLVGESMVSQQYRLLAKLNTHHKALASGLEERRAVIEAFKVDPPYDFADYKNIGGSSTSVGKGQESLAKIKVFKFLTDEQTMYAEAEALAQKAAKARGESIAPIKLANAEEMPVLLTIDPDIAAHFPDSDAAAHDDKLRQLRAPEFGQKVGKTATEPLIGQLDPQLIEKVITKNRFQLQLCFELALRRDKSARGEMEWAWRVDTKGKISDLNLLSSTIRDKQMLDCVRNKIAGWQFPRPRAGSVEIRYPFSFSPVKG